jgi:hypothetical protein
MRSMAVIISPLIVKLSRTRRRGAASDDRRDVVERHAEHVVQHERDALRASRSWPGDGLGLSSQHFVNSFSPISEERVRRELRRRRDR